MDKNKESEKNILLQEKLYDLFSRCDLDEFNPEDFNIKRLDINRLRLEYENSFFNPQFHKKLRCILSSNPTDEIIKYMANNMKLTGADSVYGIALIGKGESDLFVIKTTKVDDYVATLHEILVGLYINQLKELVPNFIYTYDGFYCSKPLTQGKKLISWCTYSNDNKKDNHFYIENVKNSRTFRDIVSDLNLDEFLQIYLQIINALNVAYIKLDFTHYDLHNENVLVVEMDKIVSIPLYFNDKTFFINTKYVAYIIDFGNSYVYDKINNVHIGMSHMFGDNSAYVSGYKSNCYHDSFKLYMQSAFSSLVSNIPLFNQISPIYEMVTGDNIDRLEKMAMENLKKNGVVKLTLSDLIITASNDKTEYFSRDNNPKYSHEKLLKKLISYYQPLFISSTPKGERIYCHDNICNNNNEYLKNDFKNQIKCDHTSWFVEEMKNYKPSEYTIDDFLILMEIYDKLNKQKYDITPCSNPSKLINALNKHYEHTNNSIVDIKTRYQYMQNEISKTGNEETIRKSNELVNYMNLYEEYKKSIFELINIIRINKSNKSLGKKIKDKLFTLKK